MPFLVGDWLERHAVVDKGTEYKDGVEKIMSSLVGLGSGM